MLSSYKSSRSLSHLLMSSCSKLWRSAILNFFCKFDCLTVTPKELPYVTFRNKTLVLYVRYTCTARVWDSRLHNYADARVLYVRYRKKITYVPCVRSHLVHYSSESQCGIFNSTTVQRVNVRHFAKFRRDRLNRC